MMISQNPCILDIETTSLEPWDGYIICVGIKDMDTGKTIVFFNEDEKELLTDFLDYYHRKGFNEIIAYNAAFDIRFIFARCIKHGLSANGFFRSYVTDLMQIMRTGIKIYGTFNKPGKLEDWLQMLGTGKMPISSVKELYERGEISKIIQYNKIDVEQTYELWKRVQEVFGNG